MAILLMDSGPVSNLIKHQSAKKIKNQKPKTEKLIRMRIFLLCSAFTDENNARCDSSKLLDTVENEVHAQNYPHLSTSCRTDALSAEVL